MVRSGALQYAANAIKFVPDLDEIPDFEAMVGANVSAFSTDTAIAAKNLKTVIEDLSRSFAEGTDYFSVLIQVFSGVISASDQHHLRYFFIIIPPLTVNFVEKMLEEKEQLNKKGRNEASFTDDGFALGLAYFLKLLKQDNSFDSLHWFESVTAKFKQEEIEMKEKLKKAKKEQAQMIELSFKKIHSTKLEYEMLFYSFSGARIFFRDVVGADQIEGRQQPSNSNQGASSDPPPDASV